MLPALYLRPMPDTQSCLSKYRLHLAIIWCVSLLSVLLFTGPELTAQRPVYTIDVKLDTATHKLSGTVDILYTNNSAGPLDSLGIHLWGNAYANTHTALANQLLNLGQLYFRSTTEYQRGGYEKIKFSADQDSISFHYDFKHQDIGWILLSKPLLPHESIKIHASFLLKIPSSISRIGRTGDSYQFTQWYPHLAVYDKEGWHTMPYLDQGEYFNDFADYEVSMTVPQGYTIASTGMMRDKKAMGDEMTWTAKAENVIDFAWFASPHFQLIEKEIEIEKGKPIRLSVYIDTLSWVSWAHVIEYGERALRFYSEWLGSYPYPHMSIVSAPKSKGGYMEYPMVAQIGTTNGEDYLDIVVAHEVGHTWLYGILANDERSDPWMDEGLNTFFERKYAKQYYPAYQESIFPRWLRTHISMPDNDALQHTMLYSHQLAPPASDPQGQSADQYLFSAYLLPAQGLGMIESKLGAQKMKSMFRQYFLDHQFSHVSPIDLRVSFEKTCKCDLSWYFDDWIHSAGDMYYKIKKFKPKAREVTLINKGNTDLPVHITTYKSGKQVSDYWLLGFRGQKTYHLDQRADHVRLFKDVPTVNIEGWNNTCPEKFLPHISLIPKVGSYERGTWSISPFIGHNQGDGILLGPVMISDIFPQHRFKWTIAPLYGLESESLSGYAEGRWSADFTKGVFDKMLISVSVNHFGYDVDTHYLFRDKYLRISPELAFRVALNKDHTHLTQWWKYRYVDIHQYYGEGLDVDLGTYVEKIAGYGIHELSYKIASDDVLRPYVASANTQVGKGFERLNLNYQQHFTGKDKGRGIWTHAFAGYQLIDDSAIAETRFTLSGVPSFENNSSDYMYDQWLGGRNATAGIYAHQIFMKDAGFKTLADADFSSTWMTAFGISYALPLKMFHVFMDAAMYDSDRTGKVEFSYSGGVSLILLKDVFEVYLPLVESEDIRNSIQYAEKDHWYEHFSFRANIRLMNPIDVADRIMLKY